MRRYKISRYDTRFDKGKEIDVLELTWKVIASKLMQFVVTKETFAQYKSMSSLERLDIKDVGYFVGGEFNPPMRKSFNLVGRDLLCLDLDHLESWDVDEVRETYKAFTHLVHSSHSHSDERPRLRIVFPLSRTVKPEEYEPLARMVASKLDMDWFDDTTYQASRIMFLPSRSTDGDEFSYNHEADVVDPDLFLGMYEDVNDFGSWPRSSRQDLVRPTGGRAEDPFTKPGIIGAFNRAYSIPEAIEMFHLPYVESGQGDGRYTYTAGTSADGAIYYPDDGHLFSHHESDPASGNQHAFDLVRLHKFGSLDDGVDEQTVKMSERPSYRAMVTEFGNDKLVVLEMGKTNINDFDALGELEVEHEDGTRAKVKRSDLSFDSIREFISSCSADHGRLTKEEVAEVVLRAAAAGPEIDDGERDVIAAQLKEVYTYDGVTKGSIIKDIKNKAKSLKARASDGTDEIKDIQVEFIRNFLDEYYAGGAHLRRAGKQFWAFRTTHWEQVEDDYVAGQMVQSLVKLRVDPDARKQSKALAAAVGENQTSAIWSSLWRMFQAVVTEFTGGGKDPMGLRRMDMDPAINCLNGTIVFRDDGKFRLVDHRPEDYFTSVVHAGFDRDAECPTWMRFCSETFSKSGDPEDMQRHLEELMGYIMNRSRDLRAWVLLYGGTASGKSTVTDVLYGLLRDSVKNIGMDNYGDNTHATAGLIGKQLLVDDDYAEGELLNDALLKKLSEEKALDANPKGRDEYQFVSRVVPMICSNNPPKTRDTSGALYDRALVFPFNHTVPMEERDVHLGKKLAMELPGIFARCVRAYGRVVERDGWAFPEDCSKAWETWMTQSNPLKMFISEALTLKPGAFVKTMDMWDAYQKWCQLEAGNGGERLAGHKTTFYGRLERTLGIGRTRRPDGEGWCGVVLRSDLKPASNDDFE